MNNYFSSYKFGLLICCLLLSPVIAFGQDLGSSSGMFRTSKTKKTSTKKRSSATKKKRKKKSRKKAVKRNRGSNKVAKKRRSSTSKRRRRYSKPKTRRSGQKTAVRTGFQSTGKKRTGNSIAKNRLILYGGNSADPSATLEKAIETGNAARNRRDYVESEKAYRFARTLNSKDSRPVYGLGNIFSDQQRWEEAENSYRQAIEIEPKSPSPYIALSFVLTQPVVGSNLGKRYIEAEKMARQAIVLSPKNPVAFDQLGVAMELRGIISDQTLNSYRKAIELEPTFALAYAHLGRALRRNGLTKESSAAYRKAIDLATDVPTMILVADVFQSQQKYIESEQLLRNALRFDPKNPTALFLLGRALTIRKSFVEAEKVLQKSVEVSPNSFVSYALLGSLYSRRGYLTKAESTLRRALKVITKNERKRLAQEFEEVGDGFIRANRKIDAARVYKQAQTLDPDKKSVNRKLTLSKK